MDRLLNRVEMWLFIAVTAFFPISAFATLDTHLKTAGAQIQTAGETGPKLPALIGGLINAFLSVLGLIFLVLVVYAGYLWMTAGGEATKVDKAKKLLGQAIIGLVITVGAYAISAYVIDAVVVGSGGAGSECQDKGGDLKC